MASNRKDGRSEYTVEPMYWMRCPDTGENFPVSDEGERNNLETRGYAVVESPTAKSPLPATAASNSAAAAN